MLTRPMLRNFIFISLLGFILLATYAQSGRRVAGPNAYAYEASVAQLDKEVASLRARAEAMPHSWFALELAAQKHLDRARLTGNYQDYADAEALLEQAFEISGDGGPRMTRARLNYSLHRFDFIGADLSVLENRILLSNVQQANIVGLKADVAFYQGNYQDALEGYHEALALTRNSTNLFRLAVYHWYTGDFELAEQFLDEANTEANNLSPRLTAFFHLHRGLFDLDRGRYDEALAHYEAADAAFGGWWLIAEHIAEIYVLQGKTKKAKAIYEDVITKTGNPEFMNALAGISDSEEEASNWTKQARTTYERQLNQFPEASYRHALGHYLESGDANAKALDLAIANYKLRPYGESETLLAQAYLQNGQVNEAKALIETTLASVWESAELHATAALIFEASGDLDRAELERSAAQAINPDAVQNLSWLAIQTAESTQAQDK